MIGSGRCRDLPRTLAEHVLALSDTDHNGRLDFEEFYKLSHNYGWLFKHYLTNYCRMIVPPRHEEGDQIGM